MAIVSIECAKCGSPLSIVPGEVARVACAACGATARRYTELIEERATVHHSIRMRAKRPSLPSDKKLRWDANSGYEMSVSLQRLVKVERTLDRDADLYFERVTDPQTGEILHECQEPLSKHIGHGSAKKA